MDLSILDSTTTTMQATQAAAHARMSRGAGAGFATMLDQRVTGTGSARDIEAARREARHASEQLVASTLLLPLLQQVRNDPFKTDMFHGGSAEDIFGAQLDTQLADRMASSMRLPVVEQVYARITRQLEARQAGTSVRIDRHG